jgi:hypothetical protein
MENTSFKAEVIADNSGTWTTNGLAFATAVEAEQYGRDLQGRWTLVQQVRVVESTEAVNYTFSGAAGLKHI